MTSLFISYSRKDIDFARKFTEHLKGQDLDFWIDWEGIPPTVDWWQEIERGIEKANIFLFLISPDSAKSKVCRQEIEHAVRNGKRLIPVVVRDIRGEEAPAEISHLNWIFLRENDPFDRGFDRMMTAIRTDYGWVQTHSQLQIKALEWERNNHETSFLLRGKELQEAELELAANSSKEPHPTDLQRDYVLKSRQAVDRQRRITTSISTAGIIALAALAVFSFYQAGKATSQATIALTARANSEANLVVANTAQANAESARSTAVANENEAKKQAQVALARQLAAQAQSIDASRDSNKNIVILLAVQSMKIFPSSEAAQVLLNNIMHNKITLPFDKAVTSVAFSSDGQYLVTGSDDGTVRVWQSGSDYEVSRTSYEGGVSFVTFSPDNKYVISVGGSTIHVSEATTGTEMARMTQERPVTSVALSPDGKYVVSSSWWDSTIHIWDTLTGKEATHMTHNTVDSLAISSDGKYVVSGGCDSSQCSPGNVHVWNASTGQEVAYMPEEALVTSVAFSSDNKYVVSAAGATVHVWETFTGNEIATMTHDDQVTSIAVSPDSKSVVTGSYDHTARVWNITTGKEIARITHESRVTAVAFSSDGKYVISGSTWDSTDSRGYGSTARVWNASTGAELALVNHGNSVTSVAFSPDGRYVVSAGCDAAALNDNGTSCVKGSARVWLWQPGDLIAMACAETRNYGTVILTRAEWKQYIGDALPYEAVCPDPQMGSAVTSTPALQNP